MNIEHDKLTEQYTLKIPEVLKVAVSSLSQAEKKRLNKQLMIAMAEAIHQSRFNPDNYLTTHGC